MPRSLLVVALLGSLACSSSKNEAPPDPLGGCAKARAVFAKVETALMAVATSSSVPIDAFCGQLQKAVKTGHGVELAMLAAELRGKGANSKAAGILRQPLEDLLAKADGIATRCPEQGVAGTQAALQDQLAKTRTAIDQACTK